MLHTNQRHYFFLNLLNFKLKESINPQKGNVIHWSSLPNVPRWAKKNINTCKFWLDIKKKQFKENKITRSWMYGCHQDCWGNGRVSASGDKRGEGTKRDQGGTPPNENGHQGSGGQSGSGERGESITYHWRNHALSILQSYWMNGSQFYSFNPAPSQVQMLVTVNCVVEVISTQIWWTIQWC